MPPMTAWANLPYRTRMPAPGRPATDLLLQTRHSENGARFLGREQHIGTLAPGKCADLVLVKGDPSARISDIENVEIVFKDGAAFDSHRLIDSVRGQVGIR
jgi:cytosine/adenosine deaminase-related metal-dependent hydrolase